jgi:hypothetical protein
VPAALTRRLLRIGTCLALVMAALLWSSCGGSGSGSASSQTASRSAAATYVAQANSICRIAAHDTPAFPGQKAGSGYAARASDVIPYLTEVLRINRFSISRLARLHPAARQREAHDRLLRAHRERIANLQTALRAARAGNGPKFTAAIQADQQRTEPRYVRAATSLRLGSCVRG